MLETVKQMETDLKGRVKSYGKDSMQAIESMQAYVKTCNEYALHCIKINEFRVAMELLLQCEELLLSGVAGNYPYLKFQTFNNIAHANNVQGNVRLSLKYLLRSLEYGMQSQTQNADQPQAPIVETYINICNAYQFLGLLDKAVEFSDLAIGHSQQVLSQLMQAIEDPNLHQNDRDEFGKQYHSQVNLHAMSFQVKGQILEKQKLFDQAIEEYLTGKQIIEANYGTTHKMYVEFANAINGAKLRTKYFLHSNLPQGYNNNMSNNMDLSESKNSLNIIPSQTHNNNLFMREQDMMKPVGQQAAKKKRLRPNSASSHINIQQMKKANSNHNIMVNSSFQSISSIHNQPYGDSQRSKIKISRPNFRAMPIQSPQFSTRSSSGSRKRLALGKGSSKSKKKNRLMIQKGVLVTEDGSYADMNQYSSRAKLNHSHNASMQCNDCHSQMAEMRKLHKEQNEMIQQLIKSQSQHQATFAQTSQMAQQPQISPGQTLQGFNTLQSFNPQQQQMQQQPLMTQPQMYYQPPQPYYAPPPYYGPPPNYMYPPPMYGMQQPQPSFFQSRSGGFYPPPPMMNNFSGGSQLGASVRSSPDKEFEFMAQHNPDLAWEQFRKEQQQTNNNAHPPLPKLAPIRGYLNDPSQTQYSDINDRESLSGTPGRIPQQNHEIARSNQAYSDNIYIHKQPEQVPKKKNNSYEQEGILNIQVQEQDKVKEVPEHHNNNERLQQAAIKIQTYFRRHATMQRFQMLLSSMRVKDIFCRSIYLYKNGKITKRVQIIASLTSIKKNIKGKTKSVPSHITFQFYDIQLKKVVYESTHKLDQFGIKRPEDLHKTELFNKIKALLSSMQMTGNPEKDITKAMKEAYSQSFKAKDSKIQFVDPQYFNGGLDEVKKVKFTQPKVVQQTYALEESDKDIDESIQDDYEDEQVEEVTHQIVEKGALTHIVEYEHQATASFNPIKGEPALVEMRSKLFDKEKVRDAGYDMTKEKLNKFMTFHAQKSVELKKMKTKVVESKDESFNDDSFQEEIIEEEKNQKSSQKSSRKSSKSKDDKSQKNSKLAATIMIQARCKGMLVRQNAHIYKLMKLNELVCQTLLTQEKDLVFLIKVHKNYDKKKQQFYRFVVNLKSNTKCPCFIVPMSKLPADINILKDYIQQAVVIQYDRKQNKIIDIKFNEFKDIKQSITIDSQTPTIQQENKDNVQDLNQAMNKVEISAVKLQAIIRGFLARKQLEYVKKSKQICTFTLSEGKMFANVKVKQGKDKKSKPNDKLDHLKLVISNMSNKKQDSIKMEIKLKVPTEAAAMKEYLQLVLEIKWKGDKIDKASINEDKSSQKNDKSIIMEVNKVVETSKEEVKVVIEEKIIEQPPEKKKEIIEEIKKEIVTEKKQEIIPEKPVVVEVKKPVEQPKVVAGPKLQEGVILYKKKEDPKLLQLIKIQARVRGLLARNSYSTVIIEGFQMLMRMCRRLSDGKLYYVFLMRKNISQIKTMQEAFYFVTLREFTNIKEVYDLEISLDLAKNIFGRKDSTKAELQKLIMFDTNKEEFIKMLNCLDIKNSDDFTLDFAKFKKMKVEEQSIKLDDGHKAAEGFTGFKDPTNKESEEKKMNRNSSQKISNSAQRKAKRAQDSDSYGEEEEDDEDPVDMEEEYVDEYYDENEDEDKDGVIEEADSKFEVSPQPMPKAMSGGPPSEQKPITPYVVTKKDPAN